MPQTQSPASITLTAIPPRLGENEPLKVKPGETINATVYVRNGSQETVSIETFVQDFIIAEDNTHLLDSSANSPPLPATPIPVPQYISTRWSLASWVTLSPNVNIVAPGKIAQINLQIKVPDNALAGGHYAMVIHQPKALSRGNQELSLTSIKQQLGTLIYCQVEGPIQERIFPRSFHFKNFSEFGPVPYSFILDNQSDIHLKPKVTIDIYNFLNQKVDSLDIDSPNIFPLKNKKFEGNWNQFWGFGPYRAKLIVSFGKEGQLSLAENQFWVIPITLIVGILITILILIASLIASKKFLQHNKKRKNKIFDFETKLEKIKNEK
ncbi:MAG: hypothetical protein PVJ09_00020 [Candidatus Woesebacteria bacterium]|jgi:hypothetical protein